MAKYVMHVSEDPGRDMEYGVFLVIETDQPMSDEPLGIAELEFENIETIVEAAKNILKIRGVTATVSPATYMFC